MPSLTDLLLRWENLAQKGEDLTPQQLCADCPELVAPLAEMIAVLRSLPGRSLPSGDSATLPLPVLKGERTKPPGPNETTGVASAHTGGDDRTPPGYEIEGEVGRGAMGVVYRARSLTLQRPCALKMILSGTHSSEDEVKRFRTEAQAIARLQHPSIVQVFEIGEHDGKPFMALEFCGGGALDAKLAKNLLAPKAAAVLIKALAEAVQSAHEAKVIHRDLKPANVMLTEKGEPKLTDFGLAKKLDEAGATQTGTIMGTPSYMPPEQARGEKNIGPTADVYALGAVLYECLASRPPFRAPTTYETILQVLTQEPVSVRQLNPLAPADLETIAHKCLQKDAAKRYATAQQLADDLGRYLKGEPILARPVGPVERAVKWVNRNAVVSALAACVLLVFAIGAVTATVFGIQASNEATRAKDAFQKADDEQRSRARAQIDALIDAAPGAVPIILASLEQRRDDVLPPLRQRHAAEKDAMRKARLALALLHEDPEGMRAGLADAMMKADEPAEMLLIRDALVPHAQGLADGLWARVGDGKGEGFKALVALAAFDAKNPRWKQEAPKLVERLLNENPLHLGVWVGGLEPIRVTLAEPLGVVFRDTAPERTVARVAAAEVLARYVGDQPEVLQELLLDADGKQFALLKPHIEKHRERISARMQAELAKVPDYWKDAPLNPAWTLDEKTRSEVENAGGVVAERWAMCQSLPMERLAAVTEAMGKAGYRPLTARPYVLSQPEAQARVLGIAVVWMRDGGEWKLDSTLTLDALHQRDAVQQKAGFVSADIAAYATKDGVRYLALWRRADKDEKAVLFADVPEPNMSAETAARQKDGLVPLRVQSSSDAKGETRYCGVWISRKDEEANLSWTDDEGKHAGHVADSDRLLLDVDLRQAAPPRPAREFWLANLRQQQALVLKQPDASNSHYFIGVALYNLGRDAEAVKALELYHAKSKSFFGHGHLALLHARAGKADEARQALASFTNIQTDRILVAVLTAQLEVYLGNADKALTALEEQLKANEKDPAWLYAAARVYGRAAEATGVRQHGVQAATLVGVPSLALLGVTAKSETADKYAERALSLLRQAVAAGYVEFATLQTDADLEAIRTMPGYRDILVKTKLNRRYASVWSGDATKQAESLQGLSPEAHLAKCREQAAKGYRPVALSLASVGEKTPLAASVWHRPIVLADKLTLARQQANAAATLLVLKQPENAWDVFKHSPEPTSRSWLVWRAGEFGSDARQLIARLEVEKDTSARRALILALGEYTEQELPPDVREPLVKKLLGWYREDGDPGIHAAISWLLRHSHEGPEKRLLDWGQAKALDAIDKELIGKKPRLVGVKPDPRAAGWEVNTQGQTMILVQGPINFRMGSPLWEPDRIAINERPHMRRIPHSYAIASTPVTVAEWERFLKDRPERRYAYIKRYSPEDDGPIITMSWYDAAEYCNWLSEKEGIPEDQWCYPKKIASGMRMEPGYLKRTGYRLPTEAELEFACKAGSEDSRYFGGEISLLPRYAHFQANSKDRTWPVGQKRPNDLGLFDAQGNVWNWCQDKALFYPRRRSAMLAIESVDMSNIDESSSRALRGGSFGIHAPNVRASVRSNERPGSRNDSIGLRVCCTSRPCAVRARIGRSFRPLERADVRSPGGRPVRVAGATGRRICAARWFW